MFSILHLILGLYLFYIVKYNFVIKIFFLFFYQKKSSESESYSSESSASNFLNILIL